MKNKFQVYISCPMSVSMTLLRNYVEAASKMGAEVTYWNRTSSYGLTENVRTCDAFILVLPGRAFNYSINDLPIGCKRELQEAISYRRDIYIAYNTRDGVFAFYNTTINGGTIKGISGSSYELANSIGIHNGLEANKKARLEEFSKHSIVDESRNFCGSIPTNVNPCSEIRPTENKWELLCDTDKFGNVQKVNLVQMMEWFNEALLRYKQDRRLLL